jgi:hypothetical protein
MIMTPIEIIHELAKAGITDITEVAARLNRRGVPPPPTADRWTPADVSRINYAEAWRRLANRGR